MPRKKKNEFDLIEDTMRDLFTVTQTTGRKPHKLDIYYTRLQKGETVILIEGRDFAHGERFVIRERLRQYLQYRGFDLQADKRTIKGKVAYACRAIE